MCRRGVRAGTSGVKQFTTFYLFSRRIDTSPVWLNYVVCRTDPQASPDQESKMKLKRRWNERTRLILTLDLAVVLPAAALVILSALNLKQVQRDHGFEAAIQREFGQILQFPKSRLITGRMSWL